MLQRKQLGFAQVHQRELNVVVEGEDDLFFLQCGILSASNFLNNFNDWQEPGGKRDIFVRRQSHKCNKIFSHIFFKGKHVKKLIDFIWFEVVKLQS